MRPRRSFVAFAVIAASTIGILAVDPDPRGPLANAAACWEHGSAEDAARWMSRAAADLAAAGVDPRRLELPDPSTPHVGILGEVDAGADARFDAALDRMARDDGAKAIFRALWLARSGRRAAARECLAPFATSSAVRALVEAVAP